MKLKTVVFLGSAKTKVAPWGGEARLGDRVYKYVIEFMKTRKRNLGEETVEHEISVFDPIEVFGAEGALHGSGGQLSEPHFFFAPGTASKEMEDMRNTIKAADCYLIITPEYNHTIPPALNSMMSHFGGSNYSQKPSASVTYSPGPWGGARCQIALRPFLSELGCIPVSKMCLFPSPGDLFNPDGTPIDTQARMLKQLPAMINELEWTAIALKNMRTKFPDPQQT